MIEKTSAAAPAPAALSGRWSFIKLAVLLGLLTAFAPLATDTYLAAFPAMAADMETGVDRVQLSLSIFFLGLAVGQPIYGPLTDRFGRRRPLMVGLAVFCLASAGLALTRDIGVFLALRFVQALGGCAGMVVSRAVVRDSFNLGDSARFFTMMAAIQALGPVAAPVLGAYILKAASWPAVFALLSLLGLACLTVTRLSLPETLPPERRLRQSPAEALGAFGRLVRAPGFIVPVLAGSLGGSAIFAFISGSPFVLMDLHGLTQTQYGWTFGLLSLALGLVSQANHLLLRRFDPHQALGGALATMAVCGAAATLVVKIGAPPSLGLFLTMLFLALAPMSFIFANSTALAMAAGGRFAGSASSLVGLAQFGAAGVVSLVVSLLHDGTAGPMAVTIMGCGLAGLAVLGLGRLRRRGAAAAV
ncbi:MAG: multidrug effflux MFS transporter [Deltaproteobacteria bacterium]|jgi:DHA1 family bicyclomycin/chloramphenicol resistance-like MFS transporter|nr:multidrug effflux MFS transporter [Deltaproteobacteria bacterium]